MRRRSSQVVSCILILMLTIIGYTSYNKQSIWHPERKSLFKLPSPPQWHFGGPASPASDVPPDDHRYFSGPAFEMGADRPKQEAVVAAFKHAWSAYVRDGFGRDEYYPLSKTAANLGGEGGIGYTIVDAIDTIYLMGLKEEYQVARSWIETELSFNQSSSYSTFETTIRVLGGLLSAYHLTSDNLYLKHAEDLGHRLVAAFTVTGLPQAFVNLGQPYISVNLQPISPADAGSLQLEFKYLAQLTKNETFWHKAEHAMSVIKKGLLPNGLAPTRMNIDSATFERSVVRLGSLADSYYEYLLKQYLQTDGTEPVYQKMYNDAMDGIAENLAQVTPTDHLTYMAELQPQGPYVKGVLSESNWRLGHRQEHLVCFLAGSLMLGAVTSGSRGGKVSVPPRPEELTTRGLRDWKMGMDLLDGCMATHNTATGLAPEIAQFRSVDAVDDVAYDLDKDWFIPGRKGGHTPYEARYMLRPEILESVFLAWRLTGNIRYRAFAWNVFNSIEKYARIPAGGYATILDVDEIPVKLLDKQETFFMSETLKYLYLTFCDSSVLPLHEIVFNTEAHPFPLFKPTIVSNFV